MGQHQDERESADDRFAGIVAAEARGEPIPAADTEFRRRYEETHPDAEADADLFAAIGSLADPPDGPRGLSDDALMARVLDRARGSSPEAATSVRFGPPSVASGASIASLVRPSGARSTARRRGVAAAFGALALAATLVVAFAAELRARLFLPRPDPIGDTSDPHPAPRMSPSITATHDAVRPEAPQTAPGEAAEPTPVQREAPVQAPVSPAHASALATALPTASERASADELLRRAQAHLAGGHATEAIDAYRELCARYPASAEGRAALVSLGRLALDQGHSDEALGHLDRYLASPGPLDEEARYWRIDALSRLHRAGDEAAAIDEFLRRHPDSVHAKRLRARAATLAGE